MSGDQLASGFIQAFLSIAGGCVSLFGSAAPAWLRFFNEVERAANLSPSVCSDSHPHGFRAWYRALSTYCYLSEHLPYFLFVIIVLLHHRARTTPNLHRLQCSVATSNSSMPSIPGPYYRYDVYIWQRSLFSIGIWQSKFVTIKTHPGKFSEPVIVRWWTYCNRCVCNLWDRLCYTLTSTRWIVHEIEGKGAQEGFQEIKANVWDFQFCLKLPTYLLLY